MTEYNTDLSYDQPPLEDWNDWHESLHKSTDKPAEQPLDEITQLKLNFQFAMDQMQADRDFYMQGNLQKDKEIEGLHQRVKWLEKAYTGTKSRLKWTQDVITHPSLKPIEASVLIELSGIKGRMSPIQEGELQGKWKAQRNDLKVGNVKDEDTLTSAMKSLDRKGFISYQLDVSRGSHSKAYAFDIPETIMKDPRSYRPPQETLARPKRTTECPNCKSERVTMTRKKATLCKCSDCNNMWVEDEKENVIMEAGVLPQDFASVKSDYVADLKEQKEAAKEFDEALKAANVEHRTSLFEELEPKKPRKTKVKTPNLGDIDPRIPDRDCIKCGKRDWVLDEVFELPTCRSCEKC